MSTTVPFTEYFDFAPKSKRKAGDGLDEGAYPFFVSSQNKIKRTNDPDYNGEALVFGTGGNASVHYVSGEFSTSGDCIVAFVKKNKHAAKAINYYLRGNMRLLEAGFKGAGLKHISKKYISDLQLPNLNKIDIEGALKILDKADLVQKKRQQAIENFNELLCSIFEDMFNQDKMLNYEVSSIEKMLKNEKNSIRTGPFGSQLLHSEFVEDGVRVLGIDNAVKNKFSWGQPRFITEEKYSQLKRYTVKSGDVIITIMGTCGRCAVVPNDIPKAINTKHLCCITLDQNKCLPEFLHSYFLMHPISLDYLAAKSKGAIMDGLNMGLIKSMPIPKIPVSYQRDYVAKKIKIMNDIENHELALQQSKELYDALVQNVFKEGI